MPDYSCPVCDYDADSLADKKRHVREHRLTASLQDAVDSIHAPSTHRANGRKNRKGADQ